MEECGYLSDAVGVCAYQEGGRGKDDSARSSTPIHFNILTTIEAIEDAVEKFLEADAQAISTRWEMINPDVGSRRTKSTI